MTAYGRAWLLVAVLVGALGLVEMLLDVSPLAAWTAAAAVASISSLVYLARLARLEVKATVGAVAAVGVVGGLVGAATTGLGAVAGGGRAVALVAVLVCCHPRVLRLVRATAQRGGRWLRSADGTGPGTASGAAPSVSRPSSPPARPVVVPAADEVPDPTTPELWPEAAAVSRLSTADLCWGWRTSFTALTRTSAHTDRQRFLGLVAVRQRYLDEIARRDPAGFVRWLQAGARPAGDPSRYLRSSAEPAGPWLAGAEGEA